MCIYIFFGDKIKIPKHKNVDCHQLYLSHQQLEYHVNQGKRELILNVKVNK
jgi:hypothetical protein